MIFKETNLPGVFEIRLEPFHDARGFFARSWCQTEFEDHGLDPNVVQCNDSLDFIKPERLGESLRICSAVVDVLENNRRYRNLSPYCEPQLGKRGLYRSTGGEAIELEINARLWVLNFSDGEHSLLDIAERSGLPFAVIRDAATLLHENGLLAVTSESKINETGDAPHCRGYLPSITSRLFRSQKLHVRIALTTIILLSASAPVCHLNKLLRCAQVHRQEAALRGAV
jgi:hypothetical protein